MAFLYTELWWLFLAILAMIVAIIPDRWLGTLVAAIGFSAVAPLTYPDSTMATIFVIVLVLYSVSKAIREEVEES